MKAYNRGTSLLKYNIQAPLVSTTLLTFSFYANLFCVELKMKNKNEKKKTNVRINDER